jgi:hypothetical protein
LNRTTCAICLNKRADAAPSWQTQNFSLLVISNGIVMQIHLPYYALGARAYGLETLVSFEDGELGVPHLHGVE